ncbi:MAG: carboxypeptidase M32 [Pirellulales bacterium]|nr:carboxypeptidase M32 [Pirellulales bacterium]
MSKTVKLFDEVCQHARRTATLASINELLGWDERTMLPPGGAEHRADQSTLLAGMIHQRWIDEKFGERLEELSARLSEENGADAAVVVRRLKRQRDKKVKLPQSLVEELARTAILGQQAWQAAREKNDFPAFRPLLERTIELKRQQAEALGYPQCPYDALLDEFEPEELTANVGPVLEKLREELVPLVTAIGQSGRKPDCSILHRGYPVEVQDRFAREAAAAIGFDFKRGRLDVTAHPFCCTLGPGDCRITTRFYDDFFNAAFFGVLHEAGHGLYEQGLPVEQYGLPTGEAVSLGIHESQSRLWENLVGRSRAFWTHYYPLAQKHFPAALGDVAADDFFFAVCEVRPSLIRVEADEATYNLHILVRFELEQALLDGDLQAANLPGAWNEKYQQYLGLAPPNDSEGVLQDVHWSAGMIGYFPTYSLGNLYAAQFFNQAETDLGGLDEHFARGEFGPLLNWLRENIHRHGQRYTAAELVERVTGRGLSASPLVEHLRSKLGSLYEL